ncbi:MAG: hypothetical protein AB1716_03150 [Planctomycetota bacterium]
MRYLGVARTENGRLIMPDAFGTPAAPQQFDVLEVGDVLLLQKLPADPQRQAEIERLTREIIAEHRPALEGLAR